MLRFKKVWLVALVTGLFFTFVSSAFAYYRSPVDVDGDNYVRFGSADYPQFEEYGLTLTIVEQSISHSWVDLQMRMWGGLVDQREIDKFLLLANGKIVEEFYPQLVDTDEGPKWSSWYQIKPSVMELIGSTVYFQVVAVQTHTHSNGVSQYAVAWSEPTKEIMMDDLPVKDKEAISILYAILEYLKKILAKLEQMLPLMQEMRDLLQKISKQIETLFTPTPQAASRLEQAAMDLMLKTPAADMVDQSKKVQDMFSNTPTNRPMSELAFGDKRDWFGTGRSHYLIDLTEWRELVQIMRNVMDAAVWVMFFFFLIRYLQPRLDI